MSINIQNCLFFFFLMCHSALSQMGDTLRDVTEIPFSQNVTYKIKSEMLFRASLPIGVLKEEKTMAVSIRTTIEVYFKLIT